MRKLLLLLFLIIFHSNCSAQWTRQVGINVVPLIANSVEVVSEFNRHPGYSLNFNAGYTFHTGYVGMIDHKVYDGLSQRKTSGAFAKAGGKLYLTGLNGKQRKTNFYLGLHVIISQYKKTALKRAVDTNYQFTDEYTPLSSQGVAVNPAISFGFTRRITQNFILDWGLQKAFIAQKNDGFGTSLRNYYPGAGSGQSDPFIGYFQGILALKYRLH